MQKGIFPCVAIPAEKVTACCSAIPTSKVLSGISAIILLKEDPESIAGLTPTICSFILASSIIVSPNTSWYFGGVFFFFPTMNSPVSLLKIPGACHFVEFPFSAGMYPLPFTVRQCNILGPGISFKSFKTLTKCSGSCPSIGPKYLKFRDSK